ncbi:MAG TPA: glycosidase, partial [Novosphingobium sp.]|nr:glycosidase [Novosphingobium sp.]
MRILDERLHADPSRVVIRPFHLGWHTSAGIARAAKLVADVAALDDDEVEEEYARVLHDFSERHWQTEQVFEQRYKDVRATLWIDDAAMSPLRKRLIGAYFCHEYTYAAAALMNPSIVPHPDQSGMRDGAVRFVMSLRAVGEG